MACPAQPLSKHSVATREGRPPPIDGAAIDEKCLWALPWARGELLATFPFLEPMWWWTGLCGSHCDCKTQLSNNHRGNFEKPPYVVRSGRTMRSILVCYSSVSQINFYTEMPSDPAASVVFWKGIVDLSHMSPN